MMRDIAHYEKVKYVQTKPCLFPHEFLYLVINAKQRHPHLEDVEFIPTQPSPHKRSIMHFEVPMVGQDSNRDSSTMGESQSVPPKRRKGLFLEQHVYKYKYNERSKHPNHEV